MIEQQTFSVGLKIPLILTFLPGLGSIKLKLFGYAKKGEALGETD